MIVVDRPADEPLEQRVRLAEAFGVLANDADGDLRVLPEHLVELRAVDDEDPHVRLRHGVGRARR